MTGSLLETIRREIEGAQPHTSCAFTIGRSGQSCKEQQTCLRPEQCISNNQVGSLQAGVYSSRNPNPPAK
ncbi:MAG: hypothetical protein U0525_03960 [Patescibacteria group bacterium]